MASPVLTLLGTNLRTWFGTRGFVLVVAAALFPMGLTGAWIGTHQSDLAAQSVTWDVPQPVEGQAVNFTANVLNAGSGAVGKFNVTMAVGQVSGNRLLPEAQNTTTLDGLAPGATAQAHLQWTARPGVFFALADADPDDLIGEREELNNQKPVPILVLYKTPGAEDQPRSTLNLNGSAGGAALDAEVLNLQVTGGSGAKAGDTVHFSVDVRNNGPAPLANASAALRVGRAFGGSFLPSKDSTQNLTLAPGETKTLTLDWTASEGAYWAEAYVSVSADSHDTNGANNRALQTVVVQPQLGPNLTPPTPPDRATIKVFYLDVLTNLHLAILIPLIAMFYAVGVVADDKETGALVYVLTRPVPRWTIPVTKFLAGFLVAAVALTVGIVGTFALLFGFTQSGDLGYLTTPLFASLAALFINGAFFTLLGTLLVQWTYLVGLAFVLGWETATVLSNSGFLAPWVKSLTLNQYIFDAIKDWRIDAGVQFVPSGAGLGALELILVVAVLFLVGSAYVMRQREFDV